MTEKIIIEGFTANFGLEHIAIVGKVGSGKTSLLLGILGEIPIIQGTIQLNHEVSFAEQEPLIVTGTI